jgi:histidyl-tRNA synthetase
VFRLLDCKVERCRELNQGAPDLFGVLGAEARSHHEGFLAALQALGRSVREDRSIVRGLDYYTRTVFEVHYPPLGARSALCGGGRYDGLVAELGGPPTPAVGFAVGFTPTELACAELGLPPAADLADLQEALAPQAWIVAISDAERPAALQLAQTLRAAGWRAVLDLRGKSPGAQFKESGRSGARWALVLGPDERAAGRVVVKDLTAGSEVTIHLSEAAAHLRAASAGA